MAVKITSYWSENKTAQGPP